jgi:hypothetical protein
MSRRGGFAKSLRRDGNLSRFAFLYGVAIGIGVVVRGVGVMIASGVSVGIGVIAGTGAGIMVVT